MNFFSYVIIILCVVLILKVNGSREKFDETAWMDRYDRINSEKYFDYSDIYEKDNSDEKIREFVPVKPTTAARTELRSKSSYRQTNYQKTSVIDIVLNAVRKAVGPSKIRAKNETSKGLDIQFETSNKDLIPTFGNNQDLQLIYLGTKWCGSGDIAKDKRDIGYFYLTDSCCRAHDLCPKSLEAQQSNFGLINTGKFTRSHCDCDQEFYRCLKSVNTLVSKQIGVFYFNVLGPQCFTEDHSLKCTKNIKSRCVNYVISDKSQPKQYQWIDNKWF